LGPAQELAFWGGDHIKALTRLTFFSLGVRNNLNDSDSSGLAVLIHMIAELESNVDKF